MGCKLLDLDFEELGVKSGNTCLFICLKKGVRATVNLRRVPCQGATAGTFDMDPLL